MKALKIVLVVLVIGALSVVAIAEEKRPQYKVTISVTYNTVPAKQAAKIVREAMEKHKDACSVEVKTELVKDGTHLTVTGGDTYWIQLPGEGNDKELN